MIFAQFKKTLKIKCNYQILTVNGPNYGSFCVAARRYYVSLIFPVPQVNSARKILTGFPDSALYYPTSKKKTTGEFLEPLRSVTFFIRFI
jgi:hypothetical protein